MSEIKIDVWNKVIRGILYALTFALPVLITPWTLDPLEFSKQMLLFVLVGAAVVVWLLQSMIKGWRIVKTPLDLPIAVFLVIYLLASIFSVDRVASFLGFYGSFTGSFLQALFLVLFYYLVVNNFHTAKQMYRLLACFFVSSLLVLLHASLQFFGWYVLRFPFAKAGNFNLAGGLIFISLFAAFVIVLALVLRSRSWFHIPLAGTVFRILAMALSFLILLTVNFLYAWVGLLAGILIYLIFQLAFSQSFLLKNFLGSFIVLVLVISFLIIQLVFPFVSVTNIFGFHLPAELRLDHSTAWPVLKGILRDRPILGTGPNTFQYAFSENRSQTFNTTVYWNKKFFKAPSEASEFLASTGVLGFLAFEMFNGIFIVYAFHFLLRKKDQDSWNVALGLFAAFAVLWVIHWFFFFNMLFGFSLWLVMASFIAFSLPESGEEARVLQISMMANPRRAVSLISLGSLGLILVIVFLFFSISVYASDIFFRKGIVAAAKAPTFDQAGADFENAIKLNRFRADYYLGYAEYLLVKLDHELKKSHPDAAQIQKLLSDSIQFGRKGVDLYPNNSDAWERLANLYAFARPLISGVDQVIVDTLTQATQKDTKNPVLFTELGQAYLAVARTVDPTILGKGQDSDTDGLSDEQEKLIGSDPENPDTNGNNVLDGREALAGLNPAGTGQLPTEFLSKYIKTDKNSLLKAEEAFRKAISLKDDYPIAYYQLALTMENIGMPNRAIDELEKALKKFPNNITFKFELGRLYFNSNRLDEAARQFQEIILIAPNHTDSHFSLALSFERLGKFQRALNEYRVVDKLQPNLPNIEAKITQLEQSAASQKSKGAK